MNEERTVTRDEEAWRDEGIVARIRDGKPLSSFQRARLLDRLAALPAPSGDGLRAAVDLYLARLDAIRKASDPEEEDLLGPGVEEAEAHLRAALEAAPVGLDVERGDPSLGQQFVTKGGAIDRDMERWIEGGCIGPQPAPRARLSRETGR